MTVLLNGTGPTAPRTMTWPDADATVLTDHAAVTVPQGGTGATSLTAHGVLVGAGTSAIAATAAGTAGKPLVSGGASADPSFGVAAVPGGGTGVATLAAHGVLIGAGASAIAVTGAGASGNVLTSNGASADPTFQAPTGTAPVGATTTATGAQNDFAPSGITFVAGQTTTLRCNNATALTLTGLAGGVDGAYALIVADNAQVNINNNDSGSSAANRIANMVAGNVSLAALSASARGQMLLRYSGAASLWRVVWHDQGDWIDYSGTGTFVGFSAFTQKVFGYRLVGKVLHLQFDIEGTSNATTLTVTLPYAIALQGSSVSSSFCRCQDNGASPANPALVYTGGDGSTTIQFFKDNALTVWTASGTKFVIGQVAFNVK